MEVTLNNKSTKHHPANQILTNYGDMGEVMEECYQGDIVLRTYDGFVSLNTRVTWRSLSTLVRKLEPGEIVTLEAE